MRSMVAEEIEDGSETCHATAPRFLGHEDDHPPRERLPRKRMATDEIGDGADDVNYRNRLPRERAY